MTITDRDPKTGQILPGGKVLPTEEAKRIGKMQKGKKEKLASADELLKDAGYDDPEDAPERRKLMAQEAAKGVIPAIKSFATKDEQAAETRAGYPAPGETCQTCNQYVIADLQISDDELDDIIGRLELEAEVDRLTRLLADKQIKFDLIEDSLPDIAERGNDPPIQ